MKTRLSIALTTLMLLSTAAMGQTVVSPAVTQLAKPVAPTDNKFCSKNVRTEVKAFCPAMVALRTGIAAKESEADLTGTLNRLNPAGSRAMKYMVALIRLRQIPQIIKAEGNVLQSAGQNRPDQQLGANTNVSGTTSLVSKAGSAELLSLAVDSGALTQSVNGTTATLGTNADEIFRILTNYEPDCLINCGRNGGPMGGFEGHVLSPLNFSASFALAQASTTTAPTTGPATGTPSTSVSAIAIPTGTGRLTTISAKYQLLNKYDPRGADFQAAWANQIAALAPDSIAVADDSLAVYQALQNDATFRAQEFVNNNNALFAAANSDTTGAALVSEFELLWKTADVETALNDPTLPNLSAALMKDRTLFSNAWALAIAKTAGTMLTAQYTFNKPLRQPQTHDITFVYGHSWGQYGSITANGSVSIYNGTLPADANYGRVHYGQASGEFDRNLTTNSLSSLQTQISLAGYWQYQPQPSVLNIPAGTVAPGTMIPLANGTQEFVGTAGNLWVTQALLTIKGAGGINIPIGVSWSNKTDLLQGSKVGAQVGISYNFSSVTGLF